MPPSFPRKRDSRAPCSLPSFLRRQEPRSPMPPSFQRRLESSGRPPSNKVCNRRWNLSILLPGLRVNRVLYLSILSTLRRPAQGHGLLPATIEQGAHQFEKLDGGPIDHIYGWAPSYKRCLWLLHGRRSCNQRTHSRRDRDRGGCREYVIPAQAGIQSSSQGSLSALYVILCSCRQTWYFRKTISQIQWYVSTYAGEETLEAQSPVG